MLLTFWGAGVGEDPWGLLCAGDNTVCAPAVAQAGMGCLAGQVASLQ